MRLNHLIFSTIFVLLTLTLSLNAGVHLVCETRSGDQSENSSTQEAFISENGLRINMKGADVDQIAIFRMDKELLWIIDNQEGSYMQMTKQDLQNLKQQMDGAMKQMQEQMKNLPPEQQEMMKKMMQGNMPEEEPVMTYKKVASGEEVGSWKCDHYEGVREGKKELDVWTVGWEELGVKAEEFKALEGMGDFFDEFKQQEMSFFRVGSKPHAAGEESEIYYGLPVKTIHYDADGTANITELTSFKSEDVPADYFDLPEGLKEQKMPGGKMHH